MASTLLLRPPSPLQIPTPPSKFTWPAQQLADPSQRTAARCRSRGGCNLTDISMRVLQSRRSIWFPYYGWHSDLPLSYPLKFPFRLNPSSHLDSLFFHLNCLSPLQNLSILHPTLLQSSLYPSNNIKSIPHDRHAKSSLHCYNRRVRCWLGAAHD